MKHSKKKERLEARRADYDKTVKGKIGFTKPGSLSK